MRKREDASLRSALSVTARRPSKRRNRGDGETWWDLGRHWGTALEYLDLEGLTIVAEKLADKLTSI
jgi:hypothetical protein